jgi:hypothetical protein
VILADDLQTKAARGGVRASGFFFAAVEMDKISNFLQTGCDVSAFQFENTFSLEVRCLDCGK